MDERSSLGTVSKRGCFFQNGRARNTHVEENLNHPFPAQAAAFLGAVGAFARCDDANFDWASKRCPDLDPAAGANRWLNGGYALSHAAATSSCAWITNFREPVARLVSAQFHCTLHDHDPLCGDRPAAWFAAANASRMARYWGNYGFTNLLLAVCKSTSELGRRGQT